VVSHNLHNYGQYEPQNDMLSQQVKLLQDSLYQLGFSCAIPDGDYSQATEDAVIAFKKYLQTLEYMEYVGVTLLMEPDSVSYSEENVGVKKNANEAEKAVLLSAESPAMDASGFETGIEINGIADVWFQEMLFNDSLDLYISEVGLKSSGEEALRVQRRLTALNYLDDTLDGVFGVNSVAALKAFQRAHGLNASGATNMETREILYSNGVKRAPRPIYNQMSAGSEGNAVEALQDKLYYLGFLTGSIDGKYGKGTTRAVKNLQNYLWLNDHPDALLVAVVTDYNEGNIDDLTSVDMTPLEYKADGIADSDLIEYMLNGSFPAYTAAVKLNSDNVQEVMRIQRRLDSLGYMTSLDPADGVFGQGTEQSLINFQKRNGLSATGVADEETQRLLFSDRPKNALKPYLLKVSVKNQKVYAYAPDHNEEYTILVRTMICSTGTTKDPTPKGTFPYATPGIDEWFFFKRFNCWARYPTFIEGNIMFHSVLYSQKDVKTLQQGSKANLGRRASHGCIRLNVEDAKWIMENIVKWTTVIIY
jgi:peptidoglycan hydrolase-like protein with peptidoglycan-binding domain